MHIILKPMKKNRQSVSPSWISLEKWSKKGLFYRLTRMWQYFSTPLKFLNPTKPPPPEKISIPPEKFQSLLKNLNSSRKNLNPSRKNINPPEISQPHGNSSPPPLKNFFFSTPPPPRKFLNTPPKKN